MNPRAEPIGRPTLIWVIIGVVLLLMMGPLLGILSLAAVIPGLGVALAYLAFGTALLVSAVRTFVKAPSCRRGMVPLYIPAFLGFAWFVGANLMQVGDRLYAGARFMMLRPQHDAIIERVNQMPSPPERGQIGVIRYRLDTGPPIRIAFPHAGGLVDNWEATIYDPTHRVAAAKGWSFSTDPPTFTAPPDVLELFGGDLVICRHVEGHYYRCAFT